MKMLIGRKTGEEFQLMFSTGFVVIQPYEEVEPSNSSGSSGGMGSAFVGGMASGMLGF